MTYAGHNKTMTTTQTKLTVETIEDHEFEGRCGHCGRENVRWIVCLSDGSKVGIECSKKLLGYKIQPKTYNWMPDFELVATYRDYGAVHALYQHKTRPAVTAIDRPGPPAHDGRGSSGLDPSWMDLRGDSR